MIFRNISNNEECVLVLTVAPGLSDIYLRSLDLCLLEHFNNRSHSEILVRRYVNDILVCTTDTSLAESTLEVVVKGAPELKFSKERPKEDRLQYLDLQLRTSSGLCWEYGKAVAKSFLPLSSCHSEHVKLGLIRNLVKASLQRPCLHSIGLSLRCLTERFGVASYHQELLLRQLVYLLSPKVSPKIY